VGEQDLVLAGDKADGMTMNSASSSGLRALQSPLCTSAFNTFNVCTASKAGCDECIGDLNDNQANTCTGYTALACLTAGGSCPQCAGCELAIEAYYRCDISVVFPTCPRLDCNLGIIPFFGEIPIIGIVINLLFGWLYNFFN